MRFFVANPTRQHARVMYRLDVDRYGEKEMRPSVAAKSRDIPAGRQVEMGDLHPEQVKSIMGQLLRYGAFSAELAAKQRVFVPYIISEKIAVPEAVMKIVIENNATIRKREGEDRRRRAAVANNATLEKITDIPNSVFEVGFEQEEDSEDAPGRIEEGFRVQAPKARGRARASV